MTAHTFSDALSLTRELIAIPSYSQISNAPISDVLAERLQQAGFETIERLVYQDTRVDPAGVAKHTLVARKGSSASGNKGPGGLGFLAHSDTVPADEAWRPFAPRIEGDRLIGRGACDMKGPLAAALVAAAGVEASALRKPLYVVITADEEQGFGGAKQAIAESKLLREGWPKHAIITEPTSLSPVYAHKGGHHVRVTARGEAAHTSTGRGVSANFLIAPFLAEMAAWEPTLRSDPRYLDEEFDPPHGGLNLTLDDGGTPSNITAAKTTATLALRAAPQMDYRGAVQHLVERAKAHGLETAVSGYDPFYTSPDAEIVRTAATITGQTPRTVSYGTDGLVYREVDGLEMLVLGPGDIAQAHTVGEWIEVAELARSVGVYREMIERLCCTLAE